MPYVGPREVNLGSWVPRQPESGILNSHLKLMGFKIQVLTFRALSLHVVYEFLKRTCTFLYIMYFSGSEIFKTSISLCILSCFCFNKVTVATNI